jgi:hypothetical protein
VSLLNDISRCQDDQCIHRTRCGRWLQRHDAGAPIMATCRDGHDADDEDYMPYPGLIPTGEVVV